MDQNIELADLVTAGLNAGGLGITATRVYLPMPDRSELESLKVYVVAAADTQVVQTRGHSYAGDYKVDIGVVQSLTTGDDETFDNDELDALMLKMRAIKNWLKTPANRRQLGESGIHYVWHATEHTPLYVPEHLEQLRQFTSFVTAHYRTTEP